MLGAIGGIFGKGIAKNLGEKSGQAAGQARAQADFEKQFESPQGLSDEVYGLQENIINRANESPEWFAKQRMSGVEGSGQGVIGGIEGQLAQEQSQLGGGQDAAYNQALSKRYQDKYGSDVNTLQRQARAKGDSDKMRASQAAAGNIVAQDEIRQNIRRQKSQIQSNRDAFALAAKRKASQGLFGGIGTAVGGVGGAIIGGPQGAMQGAQLGGGLGSSFGATKGAGNTNVSTL